MSAALASLYASLLFSNPYLADLGRELTCMTEGDSKSFERSVIEPGQDPHEFNLKTSDRLRIANAKLFFHLPKNLEYWIPKSENNFELILAPKFKDPHIWHSIEATIQVTDQMARRISQLSPNLGAEVSKCKNQFEAKAKEFERKSKTRFASIPANKRTIAVEHNSVSYLAELLNLSVVSLRGIDLSAELSPSEVSNFTQNLKNVTAVFPPNSIRAKSLTQVLQGSKVKLGLPLNYEGPTALGNPGSTVLKMWKHNTDVLFAGLSN
jgi:ABC-type Zn uptake system ZnuABC Zn-binding protein ZnuA